MQHPCKLYLFVCLVWLQCWGTRTMICMTSCTPCRGIVDANLNIRW